MKKNPIIQIIGVSAAIAISAPAFAQEPKKIVIEGGPKTVGISDRDGKPEGKLTNADIRRAASDQKGEPTIVVVEDGKVVEKTQTKVVAADLDNDGRNERYAVLWKELDVIKTPVGPKILMNADVLFDFDKTSIKPKAGVMLDKAAEFIRLSGDGKVEVVGYADAVGSKEYNSDLAWNRSLKVVEWLKEQEGFSAERFRAVGRGEEGAVEPNRKASGADNPEGRKENRRVEILIRNQQEAPTTPVPLK